MVGQDFSAPAFQPLSSELESERVMQFVSAIKSAHGRLALPALATRLAGFIALISSHRIAHGMADIKSPINALLIWTFEGKD